MKYTLRMVLHTTLLNGEGLKQLQKMHRSHNHGSHLIQLQTDYIIHTMHAKIKSKNPRIS